MLWRWTPCGAAAGHSGLMLRLRCTRLAGCKKPMIVTLEQHESSVGHVSVTSILKVRDRRSMGRRGCRTVSRSAKCVESPARRQQFQADMLGLRRREPSNLDLHSDHQSYQSKGCTSRVGTSTGPTSLFNPHIETRLAGSRKKGCEPGSGYHQAASTLKSLQCLVNWSFLKLLLFGCLIDSHRS